LLIEGHTDNKGTTEYNTHLGYFRADAVKKAFINLGVSEGQIKIVSKGETAPQVNCGTTCTPDQLAQNRVAIVKLVVNRKTTL
jgi:outer membrane protein OmpA-like peptidoglycan-associated protein